MANPERQFHDDGIFHIYNRGNNKKDIFLETEDFEVFKRMLLSGKKLFPIKLFHYCLMNNHFHMLLQTPVGENLSKLMHWVQTGYAKYFNKKYGFVGHVFQDRYRSPLINKDTYYLQCGRYIERNPVEAGIVRECDHYPHSSASFYTRGTTNKLITANDHYYDFGENSATRQKAYQKFIAYGDPYDTVINSFFDRKRIK